MQHIQDNREQDTEDTHIEQHTERTHTRQQQRYMQHIQENTERTQPQHRTTSTENSAHNYRIYSFDFIV